MNNFRYTDDNEILKDQFYNNEVDEIDMGIENYYLEEDEDTRQVNASFVKDEVVSPYELDFSSLVRDFSAMVRANRDLLNIQYLGDKYGRTVVNSLSKKYGANVSKHPEFLGFLSLVASGVVHHDWEVLNPSSKYLKLPTSIAKVRKTRRGDEIHNGHKVISSITEDEVFTKTGVQLSEAVANFVKGSEEVVISRQNPVTSEEEEIFLTKEQLQDLSLNQVAEILNHFDLDSNYLINLGFDTEAVSRVEAVRHILKDLDL